jgi:putative hydrolase of the HAD superfamily
LRRISGIKAISFDGDGTLWDFEKVMRHSLKHVLSKLRKLDSPSASMLDVDKMIEIRLQVGERLKGNVTNLEIMRLEAFKQTLKDVGRPNDELASYLNRVYLKHRFENIELFEDVLPTLKALKENYTIGLLSNGNSYPEKCGLEDMFEFVVFSQNHGVEKPDPRIFQVALENAGCSEKELLHVGDSLEDDVKGAINAGIRYLWLNRKRLECPSFVEPDCEIYSLNELLRILMK